MDPTLVAFVVIAAALTVTPGADMALLSRSATVFEIVKLVGAAYLVLLGLQALRDGLRPRAPGIAVAADRRSRGRCFGQGLLTVFYLTFLPQFISPGEAVLRRSLLLASIHVVMGLVWLSAYAFFVGRLAAALAAGPGRRAMEAITGTLLVGLELRLAFEKR